MTVSRLNFSVKKSLYFFLSFLSSAIQSQLWRFNESSSRRNPPNGFDGLSLITSRRFNKVTPTCTYNTILWLGWKHRFAVTFKFFWVAHLGLWEIVVRVPYFWVLLHFHDRDFEVFWEGAYLPLSFFPPLLLCESMSGKHNIWLD
jgi:hypothetical protein